MKHLTITVGDLTLFDGDVDEIVFTDSDAGVSVQGKMRRASSGNGSSALMQLLAGATKQAPITPTTQESDNDG
jgi:hypothetical protein